MRIGVIGAGRIGGALGEAWTKAGHDVVYGVRPGSKAPGRTAGIAEAAAHGDVVVLAVPWSAAREAVAEAGDLDGKILVDCTNLGGDETASGAEKIAGWAPRARVVKSFNQLGFESLRDPSFNGHPAVTFAAGDDAESKEAVLTLGRDVGLEMVDAGPIASARLLENLASLWIQLAFRQGLGRDFAFGLLRR